MERSLKRVDAPSDDRISELSDEIRLHILSLLTTKSAVKMGVLSKRWARLWTSAPDLLFDQKEFLRADHPPSTTTTFVNFVDRVLALRSGSGNIRRFEVLWYHGFDMPKATTWLYYAISHNVRELVLIMSTSSNPRQLLVLPGNLFCCPSLERWTLDHVNLKHASKPAIIPSPSTMRFSKLRYLRVGNIVVPTSLLGELISNCPVLECLKIAVAGHGIVHTSAPNLREFALRCTMIDKDSKIQISTPRLVGLFCSITMVIPEIDLGSLRSLAYARIQCCTNQDDNVAKLFRILMRLHNARTLILEKLTIESLAMVPDLSKKMSLLLGRVKYVSMEVLLSEDNIRIIIILLKSFTNLERLVINNFKGGEFRSDVNGFQDGGWFPQKLDCDSSCLYLLKEIKINGFVGGIDELELMVLLLQQASTLRTVILNYKEELRDHETWMDISRNLYAIPRASSTAEMLLSPMA